RWSERAVRDAVASGRSPTDPCLPAACVDPRRGARIAGELLGGGKSGDLAHLEGDDHGERQPKPWHRHEMLNPRWRLERGPNALLELADLPAQLLDLPQEVLAPRRRGGGGGGPGGRRGGRGA